MATDESEMPSRCWRHLSHSAWALALDEAVSEKPEGAMSPRSGRSAMRLQHTTAREELGAIWLPSPHEWQGGQLAAGGARRTSGRPKVMRDTACAPAAADDAVSALSAVEPAASAVERGGRDDWELNHSRGTGA